MYLFKIGMNAGELTFPLHLKLITIIYRNINRHFYLLKIGTNAGEKDRTQLGIVANLISVSSDPETPGHSAKKITTFFLICQISQRGDRVFEEI